MADKEPTHIWTLTRTEWAGQCTGFSSETKLFVLFHKKPDLKTLAPFIGKHLSSDIGQAIADVQNLIDKGTILLGDYEFELDHVQVGVQLHKDD